MSNWLEILLVVIIVIIAAPFAISFMCLIIWLIHNFIHNLRIKEVVCEPHSLIVVYKHHEEESIWYAGEQKILDPEKWIVHTEIILNGKRYSFNINDKTLYGSVESGATIRRMLKLAKDHKGRIIDAALSVINYY